MEDKVFPGFPACLEDGYTQIPNVWFEICQGIDNLAELKVVLYVIRHTWGYQDEEGNHQAIQRISTDEFAYGRRRKRDGSRIDRGTELGLTSVKEGVKRAIEHKYLICETDDSDMARIEKKYGLRFLEDEEDLGGRNTTTDSQDVAISSPNLTSGGPGSDERSYKQTSETNLQKETERKKLVPHSQFFDETLEYIKKKKVITLYQFERFLHRFMKVRGKREIHLVNHKNAVVWTGVSSQFVELHQELQDSNQAGLFFGLESQYEKGRKPKLPVATKLEDHEEQQWHPMVIRYIGT